MPNEGISFMRCRFCKSNKRLGPKCDIFAAGKLNLTSNDIKVKYNWKFPNDLNEMIKYICEYFFFLIWMSIIDNAMNSKIYMD